MTLLEDPRRHSPRIVVEEPTQIDRWFDRVTLWSGLAVLVLLGLVGLFLLLRSRQALDVTGVWKFLTTSGWRTDVHPARIGVLGLLTGTVLVAIIAIAIAVPFSVMSVIESPDGRTEPCARPRKPGLAGRE